MQQFNPPTEQNLQNQSNIWPGMPPRAPNMGCENIPINAGPQMNPGQMNPRIRGLNPMSRPALLRPGVNMPSRPMMIENQQRPIMRPMMRAMTMNGLNQRPMNMRGAMQGTMNMGGAGPRPMNMRGAMQGTMNGGGPGPGAMTMGGFNQRPMNMRGAMQGTMNGGGPGPGAMTMDGFNQRPMTMGGFNPRPMNIRGAMQGTMNIGGTMQRPAQMPNLPISDTRKMETIPAQNNLLKPPETYPQKLPVVKAPTESSIGKMPTVSKRPSNNEAKEGQMNTMGVYSSLGMGSFRPNEIEIIQAIFRNDVDAILDILTDYKTSERIDFWKALQYNNREFLKSYPFIFQLPQGPLIMGLLFGTEYGDAELINYCIRKGKTLCMVVAIFICKFVKRRIPSKANCELYDDHLSEKITRCCSSDAKVISVMYRTSLNKASSDKEKEIQRNVDEIFRYITRKSCRRLITRIISFPTKKLSKVFGAYYSTFGMSIHEHCTKERLFPSVVLFTKFAELFVTNCSYGYAQILAFCMEFKELEMILPYLIRSMRRMRRREIKEAFRRIKEATLRESCEDILTPAMFRYLAPIIS